MPADLVIKGGRVVDGTGEPAFVADVEIDNGRITRIGRLNCSARRVISAEGCVVAPGFIDIHTHYDAQLYFEPTATPSCWHGVTTVVIGNCGFTFAPSKSADMPWLLDMLGRVEGMPPAALSDGVEFRGGSFGSFLSALEGRIGVNVASFVGHAALRRWVLGPEASERAATDVEVEAMCRLLRRSLEEGGLGMSSSQLEIHADHEGRPVPPNLAKHDELVALASVLGDFDSGVSQFSPSSPVAGYSDHDRRLMLAMSEASGFKPMIINSLSFRESSPDCHRRSLAFVEEANRSGHRIRPMFNFADSPLQWSLDSTFLFDEMPTFRQALSLQGASRLAALSSRSTRERMMSDLNDRTKRQFRVDWHKIRVTSVARSHNEPLVGNSVAEIARDRGLDPLDAMLDLAIEEELQTGFSSDRTLSRQAVRVLNDLVSHPLTLAGSSDAGAHLLTFCAADYPTRLLTEAVPDVILLEAAVSRLSMQPARYLGLWDRGVLEPGKVGDVVVFDPSQLDSEPAVFRRDFPSGSKRLVISAQGYRATIVSGEVLLEGGEHTGALPGNVLRRR